MRSLSRSVVSPLIRSLFLAEATRRSLAVLAAVVWVAVPGFALALSFSPDTFQLSAQNGTPATELMLSNLSNTGDGDISFDLTLSGHVDTLNAVSFVFESMAVFFSGPRSPGAQVEGATLLSAVGITGPTITSNPDELDLLYRIPLATSEDFVISFRVTSDPNAAFSFFQESLLENCNPNAPSECVEGQGLNEVTANVVPEPSAALVFAVGLAVVGSRLRRTTVSVET